MKKLIFILFLAIQCFADTPPPGIVKLRGGTDGTVIGNISDALKVNVISGGGGGTVNQGSPNGGGANSWYVQGSLGRTWTLSNGTDSVASYQGGSWTTGRTWSLSSGSDSVTASQGAAPWSFNLTQILGAAPSATNSLATRITNGTSFVDPTQIRLLTSADTVTANQGGSWTVTANAGSGTFQTNITNSSIPVTQSGSWTNTVTQATGSNLHADIDNFPASQTVSGTVTVQQGTAASLNATVVTTGGVTIAKDSSLSTINSTLGSPFQVGGSIGNTTFASTQSGTWNLNNISGTISLPTGAAKDSSLSTINTTLGSPMQNSGGSVTANAGTNLNTSALALSATQTNGNQKTQVVDGSNATVGPITTISSINYMPVITASSSTNGSAVPSRSILISGSDGTNARNVSTDTSGNLNVNVISVPADGGHGVLSTFTQSYSSINLSTGSFTTIITNSAAQINIIDIFDTSGLDYYLSYSAYSGSCGAFSTSTNAIIVSAGGGGKPFKIPSGSCVGFEAKTSTISAGSVNMTFYE